MGIREKIKDKVKKICEDNKLEYHKIKSKVFPRVYKAINDKYVLQRIENYQVFILKKSYKILTH